MILDTDVLIRFEKARPDAMAWLNSLPETPFVAGYAALELLAGSENSTDRRRIEKLLARFEILWPSSEEMDRCVEDYGALRLAYHIGVLDRLIAATALTYGLPLATFNGKHFRFIPGLAVLQPYP